MSRLWMGVLLALAIVAAGSFAAVHAFQSGSPKGSARPAKCPARTGTGAYDTTLRPSSGRSGSTVAVSGPLPVTRENGTYGGQTATEVDVYWNLNFDKWWSVLGNSPSPVASVTGAPVKLLGKRAIATLCTFQVRVEIPTVPPGTYPIEVLYHGPARGGPSFASFAPIKFQVTRR
jgi:hypothetical protein